MFAALMFAASCAVRNGEATHNYGVNGAALPPGLARRRLPYNPGGRLKMEDPRYEPQNEQELLASIFTWWDLLDRIMLTFEPQGRLMGGYIREVQLRRMIQLVQSPNVTHYCEVGMNGGHSVVAMLLANPRMHAHTFDLMRWNYSWPAAKLLQARFGQRLELTPGYSWDTLPPWMDAAQKRELRCDLLLVDGGHSVDAARKDLQMLRKVAAPGAPIVVDDINVDPGAALRKLAKQKALVLDESYWFKKRSEHNPCQRKPEHRTLGCKEWGFAVARYTGGKLSAEAAAA